LEQAVAEFGHLQKRGSPLPRWQGREKRHSLWHKIGCQEIVQQLVAEIPWGRFLHLLNNKSVGISGYVAGLTESLLPVRHADRSEKAQGIITQLGRD